MKQKYVLLDAFTKKPFDGAQIAIFTHSGNLNTEQKQLLARELNLSETVFLSPSLNSGSDVNIEIYTPQGLSGFAGHAVLAACYAMGDSGLISGSDARVSLSDNVFEVTLGIKNQKVQIGIPINEKYDEYVPSNHELAQIIGIDPSEIGHNEYKPMIVGCPEPVLIVPVKSNKTMRDAQFHENKWQLSFVASLAKQILLFAGDHPFENVNFAARIIGKGIAMHEDPPIGTAAPEFGLYLAYGKDDYHRSSLVQRGDESSRVSILEVNVDKKGADVMELKLGGHVVKVGEGYFDLPD